MERLQRVIAARGAASRRTAEILITEGRVTVNGEVVTELGRQVDPLTDEIRVDGKMLRPQRLRTILLNKPAGYITTTKDERGRATVMDLVPARGRLYPVGRLDRDTEGLLLLTNDGELANRIMHPRYRLAKEYHVVTSRRPSEATMQRVRQGIRIDGRLIVPEEFRILRETREGVILKIVIHEGLYHAVRRMMDAVGIEVRKLRRYRIGPISVRGVPVGGWRELTPGELTQLAEAVHLDRDLAAEAALPESPQPLVVATPRAKRAPSVGRASQSRRGAQRAPLRQGARAAPAQRDGQSHSGPTSRRVAAAAADGQPARERPTNGKADSRTGRRTSAPASGPGTQGRARRARLTSDRTGGPTRQATDRRRTEEREPTQSSPQSAPAAGSRRRKPARRRTPNKGESHG